MPSGGLGNLGLTCAINTLIQCITHTPILRKFLLQNNFNENTLAYQLKDVIELLYVKNATVAPKGFLNRLFTLFPDILHFGEQHDLCELWMLISDKIADEIGQPIPPPPKTLEEDPNNLENKIHHTIYNCNNKKMSKWIENIQGMQVSVLQCNNPSCNEKYYNPEVFTTMMVDIPIEKHKDLTHLLLDFYKIEELSNSTWKCDKCHQQQGAKKQCKIVKIPKVLIIVLKRFLMTENGNFKKINDPIDITTELEFGFDNKFYKYKICSIGNHLGGYNGGHYNAIVATNEINKPTQPNNTYIWDCYDDTSCYTIHKNEAEILLNNREAYILFYQLVRD
jgi:ubiquitin C-terminal hydrolase